MQPGDRRHSGRRDLGSGEDGGGVAFPPFKCEPEAIGPCRAASGDRASGQAQARYGPRREGGRWARGQGRSGTEGDGAVNRRSRVGLVFPHAGVTVRRCRSEASRSAEVRAYRRCAECGAQIRRFVHVSRVRNPRNQAEHSNIEGLVQDGPRPVFQSDAGRRESGDWSPIGAVGFRASVRPARNQTPGRGVRARLRRSRTR